MKTWLHSRCRIAQGSAAGRLRDLPALAGAYAEGLPRLRGQLHAVNVIVPWDTLRGASAESATLEHGGMVPSETARRLACDADVARILVGPTGAALDVGRRCHSVLLAVWKALVVRDGGCVCPGCDAPLAILEAHHLAHWAHGGPTSVDNRANR